MKLLVTGGLGFIGMNFINYWLSNYKDEIVNLDLVTYASNKPEFLLENKLGTYEFVQGDICDKSTVSKITKDADCIVNFAAQSHVDNSIMDSYEFVRTNIMGTQVLLDAARDNDLRFHHISTDEVFGSLELNSSERFNENSCYNPKNPYSATKASADHLVNAYINTFRLKATISNCSNNYGPLQHSEKLIPKTILRFLSGKKAQVYGSGNQIRDWIYVSDHCSAIDAILKRGKIGESYLVGSNNEKKNIDVVRRLAEIMGLDQEQRIEHVSDRPGHDVRYGIDPSKAEQDLKWKPKVSFDEGLIETVRFYEENRNLFV